MQTLLACRTRIDLECRQGSFYSGYLSPLSGKPFLTDPSQTHLSVPVKHSPSRANQPYCLPGPFLSFYLDCIYILLTVLGSVVLQSHWNMVGAQQILDE